MKIARLLSLMCLILFSASSHAFFDSFKLSSLKSSFEEREALCRETSKEGVGAIFDKAREEKIPKHAEIINMSLHKITKINEDEELLLCKIIVDFNNSDLREHTFLYAVNMDDEIEWVNLLGFAKRVAMLQPKQGAKDQSASHAKEARTPSPKQKAVAPSSGGVNPGLTVDDCNQLEILNEVKRLLIISSLEHLDSYKESDSIRIMHYEGFGSYCVLSSSETGKDTINFSFASNQNGGISINMLSVYEGDQPVVLVNEL